MLVLTHGPGCAGCRSFVERLGAAGPEISQWDGDVSILSPVDPGAADSPFRTRVDAEGRVAGALAIQPPAVVVADQRGEIHEIVEGGSDHRLPTPDALIEWLRYLAVRCPECEGEAL